MGFWEQNCFTRQTDGVFDATYSTDGFLGTNFKIALHVKLMGFLMQPNQQMGFWEQILNFALHAQLMGFLMQL